MLKYNNEVTVRHGEAAFSDTANDALIMELSVFLTPQDKTLSFPYESTFLLHPTTCHACISFFWFFLSSLPTGIITKKASSQYSVQLPTKKLFMTSDNNT